MGLEDYLKTLNSCELGLLCSKLNLSFIDHKSTRCLVLRILSFVERGGDFLAILDSEPGFVWPGEVLLLLENESSGMADPPSGTNSPTRGTTVGTPAGVLNVTPLSPPNAARQRLSFTPPGRRSSVSAANVSSAIGSAATAPSPASPASEEATRALIDALKAIALNSSSRNAPSPSTARLNFSRECDKKKVCFAGRPEENVNRFLDKFLQINRYFEVSESDLLLILPDTFRDHALSFYEGHKFLFSSWNQAVQSLRDTFLSPDFDRNLKGDMNSRVQAPSEALDSFISTLRNMNSQLNRPYDELDLLDMILSHLNPELLKATSQATFNSILELQQFGRRVEAANLRAANYQPTPDRLLQTYAPTAQNNLSRPRQPTARVAEVSPTRPVSILRRPSAVVRSNSSCWNCQGRGHCFTECPSPPSVFCFKCGRPDVVATTCTCNDSRPTPTVPTGRLPPRTVNFSVPPPGYRQFPEN